MAKGRRMVGGRKQKQPYEVEKTKRRRNKREEKRSEWDETRCPICMEHPHFPCLLVCSSQGCRPYICSSDLSDCLKQSRDSSSSQSISSLSCPLCRGDLMGSTKVPHGAFSYMNSKPRSCPQDDCEFIGAHKELMKHVRSNHRHARPSEADHKRQNDWARLEAIIDFQDTLSATGLSYSAPNEGDDPHYSPTSPNRDIDEEDVHWDYPHYTSTSPSRGPLMYTGDIHEDDVY